MRKTFAASLILGLGLSFNTAADAPAVAVDIAPLHSLVSQVMKGVGEPDLLIPAEASPHQYTLRPSQAQALSRAQVVFWVGEELTPWLEKATDNIAESAEKVGVLKLATTSTHDYREGATFEKHAHHDEHDEHKAEHDDHGSHDHHDDHDEHKAEHDDHDSHDHHDDHDKHKDEDDHHHHHAHEGVDPHAWLDPANAKAWIKEIRNVLAKHDPENAKMYEENATKALMALDQLIEETQARISRLGELKFIVFHDAYQYFEKRFGISAAGSISLGDAEDPSPARIAEIRETVVKLGVNCVFTEPQYNPGLVHNVFEGTSVTTIGVMDPLGSSIEPGQQHYSRLIEGMVKSLSGCKG